MQGAGTSCCLTVYTGTTFSLMISLGYSCFTTLTYVLGTSTTLYSKSTTGTYTCTGSLIICVSLSMTGYFLYSVSTLTFSWISGTSTIRSTGFATSMLGPLTGTSLITSTFCIYVLKTGTSLITSTIFITYSRFMTCTIFSTISGHATALYTILSTGTIFYT